MYLNRVFEKITRTDSEVQYGSGSGDMPIPLLIILYNGKEDFPKEKTLYLESVFKKKEGVKIPVDMEIKVININKGCNPEIESRSKTLTAYITCIDKIREYEKIYPLDEAVKLAVKYCIDNDLYSEYFIKNSSEVMNMLTAEFNLDEYKKVMRKEGEKKGRAEGFEEGIEQGEKRVLKLMEQGLSYEEIKKRLEETSKKDLWEPYNCYSFSNWYTISVSQVKPTGGGRGKQYLLHFKLTPPIVMEVIKWKEKIL